MSTEFLRMGDSGYCEETNGGSLRLSSSPPPTGAHQDIDAYTVDTTTTYNDSDVTHVYENGAAGDNTPHDSMDVSNDSSMTQTSGIKSTLVHSNGHVKSHRGDVKHHVTFSDERIVTEVLTNGDERRYSSSGDDASHVSVLKLDQDGHPQYDIAESVVETVIETQYREIPVTSPMAEEQPLLDTSLAESMDSTSTTYSDCDRTVRKTLVFTGPVIRLNRWPR